MFIRYAIKVSETIIAREDGRKADCEPRYFSDFRGDRVITDAHVVQTFETAEEAQAIVDGLPVGRCGATYNNKYAYEVEPIHYSYCNMHGWSDVYPFEIIRVVSPKTIEVRAMIAELDGISSQRSFLVAFQVIVLTKTSRLTNTDLAQRVR